MWHRLEGSVSDDVAYAIEETQEGGCTVAGSWEVVQGEGLDVYLMKLAPGGAREWHAALGGSDCDMAYACQLTPDTLSSIVPTTDGGYIVAGTSQSTDIPGAPHPYPSAGDQVYSSSVTYVAKLAADGAPIWQKMYGYTDEFGYNMYGGAGFIAPATDGGYVVSAAVGTAGGLGTQVRILRLSAEGALIGEALYGGTGSDYPGGITPIAAGGYLVAGHSDSTDIAGASNSGGEDFYLIRID